MEPTKLSLCLLAGGGLTFRLGAGPVSGLLLTNPAGTTGGRFCMISPGVGYHCRHHAPDPARDWVRSECLGDQASAPRAVRVSRNGPQKTTFVTRSSPGVGKMKRPKMGSGRQPRASASSQETFGRETDGKTAHGHCPNDTLARG